ncbi:MAG: YcnI family protein [Rhodospirillaceae bacterium]|nr:YcnI family protein [Rhodospirillaceae bacterium]
MRILCASFVALSALSLPAAAHVTLETQQAVAGSTYKAVLRVPHGCSGSATTAVRVRVPDGMTGVKPMPKPGWQLSTTKGKLAQPISDGHGGQITEGVREIAWTGGKLLDEHYDEFVFRGTLPDKPGQTVYVPVVTECEKGVDRWIEIPEAGKTSSDYKMPAPGLRLLPKP